MRRTTSPGSSQRGGDAQTAEGLERAADDALLQAAPALGNRPLIVLAAGQNMTATPYWAEAQRRQAALSQDSGLLVDAGREGFSENDQSDTALENGIRQLTGVQLSHPAGQAYEYANENYTIPGALRREAARRAHARGMDR